MQRPKDFFGDKESIVPFCMISIIDHSHICVIMVFWSHGFNRQAGQMKRNVFFFLQKNLCIHKAISNTKIIQLLKNPVCRNWHESYHSSSISAQSSSSSTSSSKDSQGFLQEIWHINITNLFFVPRSSNKTIPFLL